MNGGIMFDNFVSWANNPIVWAVIVAILGLIGWIVKKTKNTTDDKIFGFIKAALLAMVGKSPKKPG